MTSVATPPAKRSKSAQCTRLPSFASLLGATPSERLPLSAPSSPCAFERKVPALTSFSSFTETPRRPQLQTHTPAPSTRKEVVEPVKNFAFISHSPATFPLHEPCIDNAQLARRKRRRTSPNELAILQREFEEGSTPNRAKRQEIAAKVSMTEKAVQIWFQNKRQALRRQSLSTGANCPRTVELSLHGTPTKGTINFSTSPNDVCSSPTKQIPTSPVYLKFRSRPSPDRRLSSSPTRPLPAQPNFRVYQDPRTMSSPSAVSEPTALKERDVNVRAPKKEAEIDCIENLLSLKAGNWKSS